MREPRTRILLVDDEQDLLWALQHCLRDEGYEVLTAYDGTEALALARRHRPDLVILDILMPGLDGLEVCRRLRRHPNLGAVPILFLTVRGDVPNRVEGLNEGGDDYLIKPFDVEELKARIRALLRRARPTTARGPGLESEDFMLVAGSLALDLHRRQARVDEKAVQLTPLEFDLLHYLMLHLNEAFSSERLGQEIWGYAPRTAVSNLVRWHIRNLRRKIEPDPAHPIYIRTVTGHGYILQYEGERQV